MSKNYEFERGVTQLERPWKYRFHFFASLEETNKPSMANGLELYAFDPFSQNEAAVLFQSLCLMALISEITIEPATCLDNTGLVRSRCRQMFKFTLL